MNGIRPRPRPVAEFVSRGGVARRRLIAAAWPGLAELTAGVNRTLPARRRPLGSTLAPLPVQIRR